MERKSELTKALLGEKITTVGDAVEQIKKAL